MKIAFCGRKGSGKDTATKLLNFYLSKGRPITEKVKEETINGILSLSKESFRFDTVAFGDKLKSLLLDIYDLPQTNKYLLYYPTKDNLYFDLEKNSIQSSDSATSIPLRTLLQQTADKIKKTFGEDYFIKSLFRTIENYCKKEVIVPDCRYINEYEALRDKGFYIIKIERDSALKDSHDSENSAVNLPDDMFDAKISNNGTLKDLAFICHDIYCEISDYIKDEDKTLRVRDSKDFLKNYFSYAISPFIKQINDLIIRDESDKINPCTEYYASPNAYSFCNWSDIIESNISYNIRQSFFH